MVDRGGALARVELGSGGLGAGGCGASWARSLGRWSGDWRWAMRMRQAREEDLCGGDRRLGGLASWAWSGASEAGLGEPGGRDQSEVSRAAGQWSGVLGGRRAGHWSLPALALAGCVWRKPAGRGQAWG
jgi:hypothetical protein